MKINLTKINILCALITGAALTVTAQIDPSPRQLLQLGVDQSLRTDGPMGAYAFYYWNIVNVPTTNQNLRLAIAPGYLDGELGFKSLLGEHTDLGLGFFGGLYANSYQEVRGGQYYRGESFDGNGVGGSVSIYHLLNPNGRIPLSGIISEKMNYNNFNDTGDTDDNFERPDNQPIYTTRVGLRYGGKEPVLGPTLAMELSAWWEMDNRANSGDYGFADDRELESTTHRLFGRALLNYTTLDKKHYIVASLQGGACLNPDRLGSFRMGGMLPYTKEFPLNIPGYFYQELSVEDYGLINLMYATRIGESHFHVLGMGAASVAKYVDGMGQAGAFNSGVGAGVAYTSPNKRWRIVNMYGYGINAERNHGDGGFNVGLAFQYNFGETLMDSDKAFEELENANAHGATR